MKRIVPLVFMVILLVACSADRSSEEKKERVTPVETALVEKDDFIIERKIVGRAETSQSSAVIPKTPGELVSLKVSKGDRVVEGQTLAVVDPGDGESQIKLQKLAVQQAEKQLENAEIAEQQAELGLENAQEQVDLAEKASQTQSSQSSQAIEAARQQYEQAQALADQTKQLVEEGSVPEAFYEQAQNRADQAQAQYQQLKNQQKPSSSAVSQAKAQVNQAEQQLKQARVSVEQAQLQVEQAKVQLNQAEDQASNQVITAPSGGEIAALNAGKGDFVTTQQPFATIVTLNPMTVTASVTAEQLSLFEKGEQLEVEVDAIEQTMTSTVQYISSVPDDTGLYPVEAAVDNKEENIKPGMMASFILPELVVEKSWIVPTDAIVEDSGETFLYYVKEDKAVKVEVEVIESQTDKTAIDADLPVDAEVITTGQLTLDDGSKVTIMKEDV
ncbi:efflux RND transporter periplasmic adaptor subunit [Halobacillus yeomjeoni]|uniref:Efflux RND transporter periplasmic adaptor subunit n=1 Tax=Halobacillus yeomjeoni TaxID=311194 RepID=A0A931HVV5_9BACI|nr:efflux RND transporter periplasmic adaptor subunit [Halobacillus yeomjeoni]MBH0230617.1 efflux RND transporter periplasmic adaptor subunit [Halobacillus yeomjeoni]